ncbi:MAG: flavin reductase [Eubacteriales bacterium]
MNTTENKIDKTALFKLGYGLYVVTTNDGKKDNGLIVNTVVQVSDSPKRISVCVNKANYSHDIIKSTGKLNVNCLSTDAPFELFQHFGFQSGRNADKFIGDNLQRSENGLVVLGGCINAYISLSVEQYIDLDSHGMFICTIDEAKTLNKAESMTYAYYHANVKPKPETNKKKGYVCKICGYVYEGDTLPEDFICPLCKHPASDFEEIK